MGKLPKLTHANRLGTGRNRDPVAIITYRERAESNRSRIAAGSLPRGKQLLDRLDGGGTKHKFPIGKRVIIGIVFMRTGPIPMIRVNDVDDFQLLQNCVRSQHWPKSQQCYRNRIAQEPHELDVARVDRR